MSTLRATNIKHELSSTNQIVLGSDGSIGGTLGDTLAAKIEGTTAAWTSYTPTLAGTGWSLGDGSLTGAYCQLGRAIHFWAKFTFGSTSTAGSAIATISPPQNVKNYGTDTMPGPMQGVLYDASVGLTYLVTPRASNTSGIAFRTLYDATGRMQNIINGTPITFATGDIIAVAGTYERTAS